MKNLNKQIGSYSEKLAQTFLKNHGYTILDCNFRNHLGEIDIICKKDSILVIIEVKSRYSDQYGTPRESVTYSKQKSIIKVAKSYILYKHMYNTNVRFDVIEVYLNNNDNFFIINHIKDAFRIAQ
ncbi:MAG: YraN family protein [Clostridium sp.]|nr:YraN family protein [Clostridium sp.]